MLLTHLTLLTLTLGGAIPGDIILVPQDQPTIQAGIDAAVAGDEVVVAPGTYNEVIDFLGKAITLRSSDGPEVTIIDGTGLNDSVVKCVSGEGPSTVLEGFTVTGGTGRESGGITSGGGMIVVDGSPTIRGCRFFGNVATRGGGLAYFGGSVDIAECVVEQNHAIGPGESGPGGGLFVDGATSGGLVIDSSFIQNTAVFKGE